MASTTSGSRHDRRLARLSGLTVAALRRIWRRLDDAPNPQQTYRDQVGPVMVGVLTASQLSAVREGDSYITSVLEELDYGPTITPSTVHPRAFAGVDGTGLPLESLLAQSMDVFSRKADEMAGEMLPALRATESWLEGVVETVVADANRAAEQASMGQREWLTGFIRAVEPGACSRCMILAGKFFLFNEGFLRHPRCRCSHIPAPDARTADGKAAHDRLIAAESPERLFESLTEEEQNERFGEAGAQAIRDGADMGQVVNARRGMRRAQYGNETVLTTTVGATKRQRVRLMPESILRIADGDPEERIRLLRLHGYIQ